MSKKIQYFLAGETPPFGHTLGVNALAYNPTLNLPGSTEETGTLFTGGGDGRVNAWSSSKTAGGTSSVQKACDIHTNWVTSLVCVNDKVVSCSSDTTVKLWDPTENSPSSFVGSHSDYAQCLASPAPRNPDYIASGGLDGHIKGWDITQSGDQFSTPVFDFHLPDAACSVYSLAAANAAQNQAGTKGLLVSGSSDAVIRLWDPREQTAVTRFRGHTRNVKALLFDGELIISGSADGSMKLWSLTAGKLMRTLFSHSASVWSLYSNTENFSTFYSGDRNGELRRNTRKDLDITSELVCKQEKGITSIALVDDDKQIWTSSLDKVLYRWPNNVESHEPAEPQEVITGGECLLFHRLLNDKRRVLVMLTNGVVKLVDIMKGQVIDRGLPVLDPTKDVSDQMDAVAAKVNTLDVLDNWCQVSVRAGQLCVTMDERSFANTEVYIDDLQDEGVVSFGDVDSERRINLGKWMLVNMFRSFQKAEISKCQKLIDANAEAEETASKYASRSPDVEQSSMKSSDKPKFLHKLFSSRKSRQANEDSGSSVNTRESPAASPNADSGSTTKDHADIKGPLPVDYLSLLDFVAANNRLNPPTIEAYPDLNTAADTRVFISDVSAEAGASTVDFQFRISQLDEERSVAQLEHKLPMWVGRVLLENTIPSRVVNKVSFTLIPYEGEDAPTISTEKTRLMAHPILRTKKIMGYVIKALLASHYLTDEDVKGVDPEEVCDLYCNGTLLNIRMTLATIRTRVWRNGGDVVINYKLKPAFTRPEKECKQSLPTAQ